MHLSLSHHGRETQQQQQDGREARRLFKESVRSDWDYPPLSAYRAATSGLPPSRESHTVGGFKIHEGVASNIVNQVVPEIAEWHERQYGSSDSDLDGSQADGSLASERARGKSTSPKFMFEDPSRVKEELADRRQMRAIKRQRMLAEEMEWNDGLHHFITRRDAWTGAKTKTQARLLQAAKLSAVGHESSSSPATPSPRSSTSLATDATTSSRPSTAMTSPDPSSIPTLQPLPPDMLIPRMSRVLSGHPIRKKIGPNMYSEIYSKIIMQSRTPSVPINLLNLTRALVSGWKSDGEWPPKPSMPEPSIGKKRGGLREGVKAAARVLKITSSDVVLPKDEREAG